MVLMLVLMLVGKRLRDVEVMLDEDKIDREVVLEEIGRMQVFKEYNKRKNLVERRRRQGYKMFVESDEDYDDEYFL